MAGNHGHDGHFSAVSIGIMIGLGAVVWLFQGAWDLVVSIVEFIF